MKKILAQIIAPPKSSGTINDPVPQKPHSKAPLCSELSLVAIDWQEPWKWFCFIFGKQTSGKGLFV